MTCLFVVIFPCEMIILLGLLVNYNEDALIINHMYVFYLIY